MRIPNGASVATLILCAAACNQAPSRSPAESDADLHPPFPLPAPIVAPKPVELPPPPPPARPNYEFREGSAYGYVAALSEDDRRAGRAAGEVLMYRYRGVQNGRYVLELVGAGGGVIGRSECANPCNAIILHEGGTVRRLAYHPTSIIGSAMEDAIAGRLEVYGRRQPIVGRQSDDGTASRNETATH
jgi:hypothetical protein